MEADVDITLPRVRESVPRARRLVESVAMAIAAPSPRVADLVLAVSELCTNVVQHASGEAFRLRLEVSSGAATARIDDEGTLRTGRADSPNGDRHAMPPSTSLRGRGLAIVEALVDQVRIDEHSHGEWTVTLQHDLYDSPFAASA